MLKCAETACALNNLRRSEKFNTNYAETALILRTLIVLIANQFRRALHEPDGEKKHCIIGLVSIK